MIGSSKNKRENYQRKCFWTQEKETRVKFKPRLSTNRPSNNWAQVSQKCLWRQIPRSKRGLSRAGIDWCIQFTESNHKYSSLLLSAPSFNSSSLLYFVYLLLSVVSSAHVTCFQKFRTNKVCVARAITVHTFTRFQNAVVHHQISSKNKGQGWEKVGIEWTNRASISKQKNKIFWQ